jgi:hypothetical protein
MYDLKLLLLLQQPARLARCYAAAAATAHGTNHDIQKLVLLLLLLLPLLGWLCSIFRHFTFGCCCSAAAICRCCQISGRSI